MFNKKRQSKQEPGIDRERDPGKVRPHRRARPGSGRLKGQRKRGRVPAVSGRPRDRVIGRLVAITYEDAVREGYV